MNTLVTINARADKPNSIKYTEELENSLRTIGKLISLGIYDNMFLQIPVQSQANTFEIHFNKSWQSQKNQ